MINNLFDAHVKEQMANAKPDVPPHIWDNIIAKKERKKPVVFWMNNLGKGFLLLLVLGTLGGIVFYKTSQKNNSSLQTNIYAANSSDIKLSQKNTLAFDPDPTFIQPSQTAASVKDDENIILLKKRTGKPHNVFKPGFLSEGNSTESFVEIENKEEHTLFYSQKEENLSRQIFNADLLKSNFFNPDLQHKYLPKSPFIPCPEIEKNAAGSKRYIEFYGGPDYTFRSFSDTANSVYLQQRKASTKYLLAYSVGIRYTRVFGSGMSFRTGLNYSQINEQFTSEKGRIIQNVYIVNTNGDTTGTYAQTGTLYKTSTNKYKSIDIPISVGYEMGNGRIHSNINLGAMVNIRSSQKGFVLDTNGKPVEITSGKSTSIYQYKTKAGVSFIGAASVYYKLNDRLHLMAEPYIRLALSPATKAELSLKEKFHTTGIRVGMRMDF